MPDKVEIVEENEIFRKYIFRMIEAKLRFERYNGELSDTITRINFERGDAVAAIMHNPADDTLVLIEQFRYPAYHKAGGWVIELPAGVVETGESPDETMKREIEEETGYRAAIIHHLQTFFVSPGGTSERIFLYYGRINPQDKISAGGGLAAENEDIKVMHPTIDEALQLMNDKKITDAKTLIGLQWLQLNRNHLPK
jgi:nudix-type nucleoside diphosphatase (YffH/AdpP family)